MPTNDREALRRRFEKEPDFVNMKRFGYSLKRCEEKYPEGLTDDGAVAAAVCLPEAAIESEMERIARKLQAIMAVEVEVETYVTPQLWLMLAPILPPGTLED